MESMFKLCDIYHFPYFRIIYDMLFYFIVIIIVLNLIFGVIIDTFADLRSEKQTKEEVIKNSCFICGLERKVSSLLKRSRKDCFKSRRFLFVFLFITPLSIQFGLRTLLRRSMIKTLPRFFDGKKIINHLSILSL